MRTQLYPRVVVLFAAIAAPGDGALRRSTPGGATLRAARQPPGLSAKDLYASGALLTPQQQQVFGSGTGGGGGGGGGGTSTPAAGGGPAPFVGANLPQGVTPDEDQLVRTVYGEARGEADRRTDCRRQRHQDPDAEGRPRRAGHCLRAGTQFEAWSDPKNRLRHGCQPVPTDAQYQAIAQ